MGKDKTYPLTLSGQELHDLIDAFARWAAERYRREQEQEEAKKDG